MNSVRLKESTQVEADLLSQQWLEYFRIYLKNLSPSFHHTVLKELNYALSSQSYFGGNKITEADTTVFKALKNMMKYNVRESLTGYHLWGENRGHLYRVKTISILKKFFLEMANE